MDMEEEIEALKNQVRELTQRLQEKSTETGEVGNSKEDLTSNDVVRYSRQILVPEFGKEGQEALKKAKVLVLGVGGLGCPCLTYLAAAGIGELIIIDYDVVEISNLHRQILHTEDSIGKNKVDSAKERLESLNSGLKVIPINMHLNSMTLKDLFIKHAFDVVVDGSDNVATRYLLNDICVMNKIPLVSGSALQMEGQLTVYNYIGGPCYRCIFPKPPPPHTVTSCGDGGVLGPVPGVIGVLQALETIKILNKSENVLSGRLLTFDGSGVIFRNIKLRNRNVNCAVCGDSPTITRLIDYEEFCGAGAHDKIINISILKPEENVDATSLSSLAGKFIIDVRPSLEFQMCHINGSVNVPLKNIQNFKELNKSETIFKSLSKQQAYVICRRGNDSQRAIAILKDCFAQLEIKFYNVKGGLHAYAEKVDNKFPVY